MLFQALLEEPNRIERLTLGRLPVVVYNRAMGTTNPTGMSVQALYRLFREDKLFVNRRYQRSSSGPRPRSRR
jgi:hypothetical protein